jgi:hypothetical protein
MPCIDELQTLHYPDGDRVELALAWTPVPQHALRCG